MSNLAHYEQLLYKKRREATQVTLDAVFSIVSLPEDSTSDKPPASDEPQPSTSTGGFTRTNVPPPSLSNTDDQDVV